MCVHMYNTDICTYTHVYTHMQTALPAVTNTGNSASFPKPSRNFTFCHCQFYS